MSSVTVIKPTGSGLFNLGEVWEYRDLLLTLGTRDIKVRYKQTSIGIAWAVVQPLVTMVVYSVTFGKFAGMPSEGLPYPLFSYAGLCFWMLFSASLSSVSDCLVVNEGIIKKVYYPRVITPLAATLVCGVDFCCSILCLGGIAAYYHVRPGLLGVALVPALAIWSGLAALGIGLVLASINARYRDVRYALPFFIQLLVFVSPVIYPAKLFREHAWVLALNPMTGVIETARSTLFGAGSVEPAVVATSLITTAVFLVGGFLYFQSAQQTAADIL